MTNAAQVRLLKGCALIIGAGGLGSPAALYLAAAGVGRVGIVDQDVVELSNLHRQIIHNEARVGMHKAESAKQACIELNSSIQVVSPSLFINASLHRVCTDKPCAPQLLYDWSKLPECFMTTGHCLYISSLH